MTIVGIDNASQIFAAARHPKSFVSLDTADHLLSRREDAAYAARVLAAWASRYVSPRRRAAATAADGGRSGRGDRAGPLPAAGHGRRAHAFSRTSHRELGGSGSGPGPYDLLLAGLGACTSMTMRLYAERKGWPLTGVSVRLRHAKIHARDCADCETRDDARIDEITKEISLAGPLDAEQRARLLEIAGRCPVHRTLESEMKIRTELRDGLDRG